MVTVDGIEHGTSIVITHHVDEGRQASYEQWLGEIIPLCKTYPGHLGIQVIRPTIGGTATYTIIVHFDAQEHLRAWTDSHDRKRLIEKVRPLLTADDQFYVLSGIDFWFTPEGAKAKLPTRWKQALVTWSAIYPLVLLVSLIVLPVMRQLAIPDNYYLRMGLVTATVVLIMVYVVMPRYTQLVHRWLFR